MALTPRPKHGRLSRSAKTVFEESKDAEYADWKRVRLVIEHENTLVHYRLTWLLTSQTVLFAAVGVIVANWNPSDRFSGEFLWVIGGLGFFGVAASLLVWYGLRHAQKHISRLVRWWYASDRNKLTIDMLDTGTHPSIDIDGMVLAEQRLSRHPPVQFYSHHQVWLLNPTNLPFLFISVWAAIILFTCSEVFYFRPAEEKLARDWIHSHSPGLFHQPESSSTQGRNAP